MNWLNNVIDELFEKHPKGEIVVSSGVSPSGEYHLGTLREILTAEIIAREIKNRGRQARHLHIVDDHDVFRKVPAGIPASFEKYLGKPLSSVPSPDKTKGKSYADYFLKDLLNAAKELALDMEIIRSQEKYRKGDFVKAIELALKNIGIIKQVLINVSGHSLGDNWSPVQVNEDGYLKNRKFVSINESKKELTYLDIDGQEQTISYAKGDTKLNWRIDWPARWWLLGVDAEPFGREHATKGGSYDTGVEIAKQVYKIEPPLAVPYHFINKTGETKKMSKSAGDTVTAADVLQVMPPEIVWYFMLRMAPERQLFFDYEHGLMRLFDDFSELSAKEDKSKQDQKLLELCTQKVKGLTISSVPFSHLVSSYQAALKDPEKTLDIIGRSEYAQAVKAEKDIILRELKYIDNWLNKWAPDDVKFELKQKVDPEEFDAKQKNYFSELAGKIAAAPKDAEGEWFHAAIYDLSKEHGMQPKEAFTSLYQLIIGKDSGPRAGWFLSILPRDWLIKRLKLEA